MDLLQKKLGTTEYVQTLQRVQKGVAERRAERRRKRRIEQVSMPEVVERRKVKKREKEKIKRKEKGMMERGKRRGW
jgi:U3 small nucleolar RNA-associated protein 20